MTRPAFFDDAACKGAPVDIFFQEGQGVGLGGNAYNEARVYCARCKVRQKCLDYAIETSLQIGFFGGMTPRQRRRVKWGGA